MCKNESGNRCDRCNEYMDIHMDPEWDPEWAPDTEPLWIEALSMILATLMILGFCAMVAYTLKH